MNRLTERIARQIAEREAALMSLRDSASHAASATERERILLMVAVLEQELADWKQVAARLEHATVFESRNHRAIRMPALR